MGVARIKEINLTIKADTPEETEIAVMHYWVGYGLSCWHQLEQDLTMSYLMLTCPAGSPVDGPLASFQQIETTDEKMRHLSKVLTQVLYQDELAEFRTWAKKLINRLITLNGKRNKLAHGLAKFDHDGKPTFLPYFNWAQDYRYKAFTAHSSTPSTILAMPRWSVTDLEKVAVELREGSISSFELVERLMALFEDARPILEKAKRMTLDRGLPYDLSPPEIDPPQGQ